MSRSCLSLQRRNEEQRQKRQINKGLFLVQEEFPWVRVTFSGTCDAPRTGVSFSEKKGKGEEVRERGAGGDQGWGGEKEGETR